MNNRGFIVKKIKVVLCVLSILQGPRVDAASSTNDAREKELELAPSFDWKRVGQRVAVGAIATAGAKVAVEKLGAEKVVGIVFGLGATWLPEYWREVKIGWQELKNGAKRKEMLATGVLGGVLVVSAARVSGFSLASASPLEAWVMVAAQGAGMVALNNVYEDREEYLEQLYKANQPSAIVTQKTSEKE